MQGRPFKKPGFVEQQTGDDDGDKGGGGVPHDAPHHGNVGQVHHPKNQCHQRACAGAPAYAQAARLPDHQSDGGYKNQGGGEQKRGFLKRVGRGP